MDDRRASRRAPLRFDASEDPAFWLSFVLPTDVIDALRVLRDAARLDEATLERRTADLQLLLNRS